MGRLPAVFGRHFPCGADCILKRHPEIRRVSLYMDNDLGGLKNARRIKAMLHEDQRFKHIRVGINPPRIGKDYNEMLLHVTKK